MDIAESKSSGALERATRDARGPQQLRHFSRLLAGR